MKRLGMLAVLLLAGCSSVDRLNDSSFRPQGDGTYEFVAPGNLIYPLDSPGAERTRLDWLEEYLADNRLCPQGYEIRDRTPVVISSTSLGIGHRIYYTVACKP